MSKFAVGQTVALKKTTEHYRRGARTAVIRELDVARSAFPQRYRVKLNRVVAGRALWWLSEGNFEEIEVP